MKEEVGARGRKVKIEFNKIERDGALAKRCTLLHKIVFGFMLLKIQY